MQGLIILLFLLGCVSIKEIDIIHVNMKIIIHDTVQNTIIPQLSGITLGYYKYG